MAGQGDGSRSERKERTRRAILDAALSLTGRTSLVGISLRQVAKEVGIVPTAFYRHFESVESLGLALVDESFASLRELLRDVRGRAPAFSDLIDESVAVLVEHVRDHPAHYTFIARERMAGPRRVRDAIRHELELVSRELATDVAQLPGTEAYSAEHLQLLADLVVSFVTTTAERLIDDPAAEERILHDTRTQLRMLLVGATNWKSPTDSSG